MDSQIVMIVIAVIGVVVAYKNYSKKSPDTSKMNSSQSATNSSGIFQQTASQINIGQINIDNTSKKFEEIKKPEKNEDIEPQLKELNQPLKKEMPKISQETLNKINNTFPLKTKEYGTKFMFFKTMDEFEKSPKFISVNGRSFQDGTKTQAIENARKNLYETPKGQFVLISKQAWKDMGYDFPEII